MARFGELEDAEIDQLLRGDTPMGHDDLAPVAELAATVRTSAASRAPVMGTALRAQIQQRPHVPARYAGTARRRLGMAAAAAALMIVSVAAVQNALPAAAQRFVSNVADVVGIDVPRPDDDGGDGPAGEVEVTTPPDATTPADGNKGPATPADPGDPGDGAVPADPSGGEGTDPGGGTPEETPGGAIPADPGAPGDVEPATPATTPPPTHNGGGRVEGSGQERVSASGNGNAGSNGQATGGGDTAPAQVRDTG